jgi:steroid delta-isomerase-like uncharacterized protein
MRNWPRDFVAAFSAHDIDEVLSYFAEDIFYEEVVADGVVAHGKQELRARIQGIFDAWPDIKLELTSHFSSGEHHCMEWISSGTLANASSDVHLSDTADSQGLPATGKSISYREVVIAEQRDRKINRFSLYCDMMTLMRQLGLLPPSP